MRRLHGGGTVVDGQWINIEYNNAHCNMFRVLSYMFCIISQNRYVYEQWGKPRQVLLFDVR